MGEAVLGLRRMMGALAPYECDVCHETGEGDPATEFSREEVEHCLRGCNGSLRLVHMIRECRPVLPPIKARLITG